jgi:type VI secretion system secreted protein VgrG
MAAKPTQDTRIGSLTTALGKDKLVLLRAIVSEGLSELFEINVEALSTEANLDFGKAIGENCSVALKNYDGSQRYFSGILTASQWTGMYDERYSYRLTVRPWLWLLSRSSDCKIFKSKSVIDIINEVFGKHGGFAKCENLTHATYDPIKYCVQYRETDLNFVSRMMEEFGIYYYFTHASGEHKLVLADALSSHSSKLSGDKLVFRPLQGKVRRKEEHLFNWTAERTFNTGKVTLNDYDFKKPTASILAEKTGGGGYPNDQLGIYDYPGRYKETTQGDTFARIMLEAEQAADRRCYADGDAVFCMPGSLITLAEHPESSLNQRYLVVKASHSYTGDDYRTSEGGGGEEVYSGRYEFLPGNMPFRAPQVTPRPIVHGPQTAKVVGSGEIDVDADGCIMVQFHWDRDKVQSRRVRIAQLWSGIKWGGIYIPRVGQEVVVEFVEGDPDRPLVIGTVYNGDHPTPYPLPDEKTIAGVKSNSTTGGGGFNEFIFDDKKGSELVRMHAQKDMAAKIENDEARDVGRNVKIDIGNNKIVDIGNVWEVTAQSKIEFTVGQSKITMDPMSITIKSSMITIKADVMLEGSSPLTTIKGDATLILKGGVVLIN